jgi:hypothetical protein
VDEREQDAMRRLYDLQVALFEQQGEDIKALRRANDALQESHEIIGEMLRVTAELVRPS